MDAVMQAKALTIGHLARDTGTNVETIRFYEKSGLLPEPARTGGNYRAYEASHLDRLRFIRRARSLGFPLDQVRALLELSDDRAGPCAAIDVIAKAHLVEVERKIADLQALRHDLNRMIEQCGCGIVSDCRVIGALTP